MTTKMVTVNSLKPGAFIIIDGHPCKILDITTSAPGKHGSAKARIVAVGLLDGKRREIIRGTEDRVEVPVIEKKRGQIIMIEEGGKKVQIMDLETYETFEAEVDEEVKDKIFEGAEVEYWEIPGSGFTARVVKRVRS